VKISKQKSVCCAGVWGALDIVATHFEDFALPADFSASASAGAEGMRYMTATPMIIYHM
jgi:hypothetical protein